jgi:3-phenylpropionate/trans-cinnamate dioxygenase ferredoxin reductase component
MSAPGSVVIVGSSVAAISAADALRQRGFAGRLVVVGDEDHLPYDRPPLSKGLLSGDTEPTSLALHGADHYAKHSIELRLGSPAVSLDTTDLAVHLGNGRVVAADRVIIATGASARTLTPAGAARGVITLRNLDDGLRLRSALAQASSVAIVGGGFIGAEVASSAAKLGLAVTIVEADRLPLLGRLGVGVAQALTDAHHAAGVEVRTDTLALGIDSVDGSPRVLVSSGSSVVADVVVVGLGVTPNTAWLAGSGLEIDDGIVCDEYGRTSARNVYAVGDVASWRDPWTGRHQRVEHWTSAKEQSQVVAFNVVAEEDQLRPYVPLPYVWSDQHGSRLQVLGRPAADEEVVVVHGALDQRSFVVVYGRNGQVTGAAARDAVRELARYRKAVALGAALSEVGDVASSVQKVAP